MKIGGKTLLIKISIIFTIYLNILSLKLTTHIGIIIHVKLNKESSGIPIFLKTVKNNIPNETPNTKEIITFLNSLFTCILSRKNNLDQLNYI